MIRFLRRFPQYCPHPPSSRRDIVNARVYSLGGHFSFQILDFQSALDGIIAYAILFSLLFLSTFASPPSAGIAEVYRRSLSVAGLVSALTLVILFVYSRHSKGSPLRFALWRAKGSLIASLSALLIWLTLWVLFGEFSGTFGLNLEPTRAGFIPQALLVGLLDGAVMYAFCTGKFVRGVGRTAGILISSILGWLLFLAVSLDFALYLLPIVIVLSYIDVKTSSPIGPTVATGFLMAFFYAYFGTSAWFMGTRWVGYLLMTAVSVASAFAAALTLRKIPIGGIIHGETPTI